MIPHVVDLSYDAAADSALVGGKVAGLAQLVRSEVRVPPAFGLTRRAFDDWLATDGIDRRIGEILSRARGAERTAAEEVEREVLGLLDAVPVPEPVAAALRESYEELGARTGEDRPLVAVRSSATSEDSSGNSFAGEYVTVLDVHGYDDVLAGVRACWMSAFRREALAYATTRQVDLSASAMGVAVQAMVRARAAGVMFTLNPVSGDRSRILIEGSWGLGTAVVGGEVTPERYVVDKVTLTVTAAAAQGSDDATGPSCLSPQEVAEIAATGKRLERAFGHPLDLEWAIDERWPFPESVMFVQCRPETVWSKRARTAPYDPNASTIGWITANLVRNSQHP